MQTAAFAGSRAAIFALLLLAALPRPARANPPAPAATPAYGQFCARIGDASADLFSHRDSYSERQVMAHIESQPGITLMTYRLMTEVVHAIYRKDGPIHNAADARRFGQSACLAKWSAYYARAKPGPLRVPRVSRLPVMWPEDPVLAARVKAAEPFLARFLPAVGCLPHRTNRNFDWLRSRLLPYADARSDFHNFSPPIDSTRLPDGTCLRPVRIFGFQVMDNAALPTTVDFAAPNGQMVRRTFFLTRQSDGSYLEHFDWGHGDGRG